jgi:hypothetical protein
VIGSVWAIALRAHFTGTAGDVAQEAHRMTDLFFHGIAGDATA